MMKKFVKIISVTALIALVLVSLYIPLSATSYTTGREKTVSVTFTFDNVYGANGTFAYSNDEIFSGKSAALSDNFLGKANENKFYLYKSDDPETATITLSLTIDANAPIGSTCEITATYDEVIDKLGNITQRTQSHTVIVKANVAVTDKNGATVKELDDICEAIELAQSGHTVTVNEPVTFTKDVTVSTDINLRNMALAEFDGKKIKLVGTAASVSSDKKIESANIISGSDMYEVAESVSDGIYTYTLSALVPTIGDPSVTHGSAVAGSKVDTASKYIYIDVNPSGIDWNTFGEYVSFANTNADKVELIPTHNGVSKSLVCTGDVVTAVATNVAGGRAETTYTVIVIGDTNCNGKTDSGDAVAMMNHFMGEIELETLPLLAADTNNNGKVDSGDAVCNSNKFMLWGTEYVSHYKS